MKFFRHIALAAILVLPFAACESDAPVIDGPEVIAGADTTPSDTATADDVAAPPADLSTPQDIAAPQDMVMPEDTAVPPTDTAVAEDTAMPEDMVMPPDTAVTEDTSTPGNGACDNTTDLATFENSSTLEGDIGACVNQCLGSFTITAACFGDCVQDKTGLSAGCSVCFGQVMQCTATNCALQCLNAGSSNCTTCRNTNCTPAFVECAGVQQPGT